ncbi:MAG: hypothetical protein APF80_05050 [Alphaproteobacteria bacterium BRH_c36]|nr:MAG: hypothetical protein APF80_05050 [Alphaproteobacteria bacterium BRH_c36]
MIELVLSVCLISAPATCKDVSLSYMGDQVTPQQCMFRGQITVAQWSAGNPQWRIAKWKCGAPQEFAKL